MLCLMMSMMMIAVTGVARADDTQTLKGGVHSGIARCGGGPRVVDPSSSVCVRGCFMQVPEGGCLIAAFMQPTQTQGEPSAL